MAPARGQARGQGSPPRSRADRGRRGWRSRSRAVGHTPPKPPDKRRSTMVAIGARPIIDGHGRPRLEPCPDRSFERARETRRRARACAGGPEQRAPRRRRGRRRKDAADLRPDRPGYRGRCPRPVRRVHRPGRRLAAVRPGHRGIPRLRPARDSRRARGGRRSRPARAGAADPRPGSGARGRRLRR